MSEKIDKGHLMQMLMIGIMLALFWWWAGPTIMYLAKHLFTH